MATNSTWHRASGAAPTPATLVAPGGVAPPEAEPILSLLTDLFSTQSRPAPLPAWTYGAELPAVSRHYLEKAKELCASRGIRFHVLPCPLDRTTVFEDAEKV